MLNGHTDPQARSKGAKGIHYKQVSDSVLPSATKWGCVRAFSRSDA